MSDLISRKALLEDIKKYVSGTPLQEMFETIVDNQPTAYNVDGIVKELEEAKETHEDECGFDEFDYVDYETAISIVKGAVKE